MNSVGDGSATNPSVNGCDTGARVGSEPECTLRAAIETANATPDGAITFHIPGDDVPVIAPEAALPAVEKSTSIDGTTQSAGSVRLDGGGALDQAFGLRDGSSSIEGFEIDGFETAVDISGGSKHRRWRATASGS